ncbi:hypothetical protein M3Y98_00843700 [Aphelenchoides besseyi]|nr:hypothetical protein M3Y98_00843700 [Aphelenchoides besseyi]KAI6202476.1 hypothetical protein M3Y96_00953100 [Aphelenchoides besseyi]
MPAKVYRSTKRRGGSGLSVPSAPLNVLGTATQSQKSTPFIPHRNWQQYPQVQSELFYECTLFLYSILALFLEYLNLYKTLWWLPKSHWHTTFKFHLINPYVLSCIGLLLGIRVTKCFWTTITNKFDQVNADDNSVFWSIMEYAIIKSPLGTMITSSFVFSFSRIIGEYGYGTIFYLLLPLVVYVLMFYNYIRDGFQKVHNRWIQNGGDWFSFISEMAYFKMPSQYPRLLDEKHICDVDDRKEFWREAMILGMELRYRLYCCIYAAFFTAYFSIFLPSVFVPKRTNSGIEQHYLTESCWFHFMIVFVTSFFLYALYRFPPELIDRLYQTSCHLGSWVPPTEADMDGCSSQGYVWKNGRVVRAYEEWDRMGKQHYLHNQIVSIPTDNFNYLFKSERHPHFDRVAASPCSELHQRIYKLGENPILWVRYACIVQLVLIVWQFHELVMSTDWQHIFTLVMLMFANYVLIGKYFKDYVIFSYIYADDRKAVDGAPFPFNGRHLNKRGEYDPEPYTKTNQAFILNSNRAYQRLDIKPIGLMSSATEKPSLRSISIGQIVFICLTGLFVPSIVVSVIISIYCYCNKDARKKREKLSPQELKNERARIRLASTHDLMFCGDKFHRKRLRVPSQIEWKPEIRVVVSEGKDKEKKDANSANAHFRFSKRGNVVYDIRPSAEEVFETQPVSSTDGRITDSTNSTTQTTSAHATPSNTKRKKAKSKTRSQKTPNQKSSFTTDS